MGDAEFGSCTQTGSIVCEIITVHTVHDTTGAGLAGRLYTEGVERLLAEVTALRGVLGVTWDAQFIDRLDDVSHAEPPSEILGFKDLLSGIRRRLRGESDTARSERFRSDLQEEG